MRRTYRDDAGNEVTARAGSGSDSVFARSQRWTLVDGPPNTGAAVEDVETFLDRGVDVISDDPALVSADLDVIESLIRHETDGRNRTTLLDRLERLRVAAEG